MGLTIIGAQIFDGERFAGAGDVTVDGARIVAVGPSDPAVRSGHDTGSSRGADVVDGRGATLLPGLIDAHVHLRGVDDLRTLARWGVTTALDMGTWPASLLAEMRRAEGVADIRAVGPGAVGPGSLLTKIPGRPADSIIPDSAAARRFVAARIAEGVDYVKVIVEPALRGGPDQATVAALVQSAHDAGLMVIGHAADIASVELAQTAGVDVLTHVPLDAALDDDAVKEVVRSGRLVVPTLTMMERVSLVVPRPGLDYRHARDSVSALHEAGVPIVVGTDANQAPGVPANVHHGASVHRELELLVDAGLSPAEALRSATSLAAERFGILDRGALRIGKRADLLLVEGDVTSDIAATREIRGVWIAGKVVAEPG